MRRPPTHEEIEAAIGRPIAPGLEERVAESCARSGVPVDIDPNDPRMRDMAILSQPTGGHRPTGRHR